MNNEFLNSNNRPSIIRSGFTLVELLMVIAIIGVMSSMGLAVMRKAQQDAKEAATLSRIELIESIIAVQMEDYEVRRLPISNRDLADFVRENSYHGGSNVVTQVRQLRRRILMDIINSELPRPKLVSLVFERNPDLGRFPTNEAGIGTGSLGFLEWLDIPNYPNPFPPGPGALQLSERLRQLSPAKVQSFNRYRDPLTGNVYPEFNLPGEYLYAILELMDVDGTPAIELLGNAAVGNSDGDPFKEVVDAWGDPMQLRLWQVDGIEVDKDGVPQPGTDIWIDVEPDFDFDIRDPLTGIPKGYRVLDPTQARDLSKIRAEVVSTRLVY